MVITSSLAEMGDVVEFQYGVSNGILKLRVVPLQGADTAELRGLIMAVLSGALIKAGGVSIPMEVEFVGSIERSPDLLGKLRTRT
jgi:hypothetical protein